MRRSSHLLGCLGLTVFVSIAFADGEFPGWQAMRVIHQEGRPLIVRVADVEGDGRDELIVVNTTHSRLDVYRWLAPAERSDAETADDKTRPNDLPMADDFRRQEVPLKHLPQDVVATDLDGDGRRELVVLASPPNKILVYGLNKDGDWNLRQTFDLLPGEFAPRRQPLLLVSDADGQARIYVGCTNGIQQLTLKTDERPDWLTPRERHGREDWWLADVDGDGDRDLVEQTRESHQSLRWFVRDAAGHLSPARILFDQSIAGAAVLRSEKGADQLLVMDGVINGLLRRYKMTQGELDPLGQRRPLALDDGRKAIWCGLQLGDKSALAVVDRERPQLLLYCLESEGWGVQRTFPLVNDVRAIAAPQAKPGTLLLWAQDAAELHISQWDGGRMSYPKPWPRSEDDGPRKILALGSVGPTAWWLQQVDQDCDLYVWPKDQAEPTRARFEGVNVAKGGQAQWLGERRLLVRRDYRDSLKIAAVEKEGEKPVMRSVGHLKQAAIEELKLLLWGDQLRMTRLTDGVLQWLDNDLQPIDQVMLPQGRKLADYVPLDKQRGWALEEGGRFVHLLEADDTGIPQLKKTVKMNGGIALVRDPVLGLMLVSNDQAIQLDSGRPDELDLLESFDGRIDRRSGIKEATIHRIDCLDVDGDGVQEVLLFDDRRHQLTVLSEEAGKFKPQISWPVFEDKKYPYGDGDDAPTVTEPHAVVVWDADGDGHRDLAMTCQDRLVIYLAREKP